MRIKHGEVPRGTEVFLNDNKCYNVVEADDSEGWVDVLDQTKPVLDRNYLPRRRKTGVVRIVMPT